MTCLPQSSHSGAYHYAASNIHTISFDKRIAAREGFRHHSIRIPTTRFSSILARFGAPVYLKIDIEGNDQLCLADLASTGLPRFVSLESECPGESDNQGADEGLRSLELLRYLGYSRFKLIDQYTFCSLSQPASPSSVLDSFSRRFLFGSLKALPGSYRVGSRLLVRDRLRKKFQWEFPSGCSGAWGEDTAGYWMTYQQAERSYCHFRDLNFRDPSAESHSFWCDWHAKL